jgi:hypothetical protein
LINFQIDFSSDSDFVEYGKGDIKKPFVLRKRMNKLQRRRKNTIRFRI